MLYNYRPSRSRLRGSSLRAQAQNNSVCVCVGGGGGGGGGHRGLFAGIDPCESHHHTLLCAREQ